MVNVMRESVKTGGETNVMRNERTGVPSEIRIWGEAIQAGKADPKRSPEEALADLEILEAMLKSGEQNGQQTFLRNSR